MAASESTPRPFPRDYGQICGYRISCLADRFEAVRGDVVLSQEWDGGRIMPSLDLLVNAIMDREYGKQRI